MSLLVEFASYAGYLFLLLTAWSSIRAAWRQRDVNHLNVLFVVGSLVCASLFKGQPGTVLWTLHTLLFLVQPYLAVRLIQQFRDVPAIIERGGIGVAIAGLIALLGWPTDRPQVIDITVPVALSLLQTYVAVAFARESQRTAGVTAKRLVFASAGASALGFLFLVIGLIEWAPSLKWTGSGVDKVLSAVVFFSYFIAFATPHRLKKRWREAEHSRFLRNTANRDAEARGDHAAEDLNEAVCRSVANVVTLVALPKEVGSADLVVWASSDPSLDGVSIVPSTGLIGHAFRSGAIAEYGDRLRAGNRGSASATRIARARRADCHRAPHLGHRPGRAASRVAVPGGRYAAGRAVGPLHRHGARPRLAGPGIAPGASGTRPPARCARPRSAWASCSAASRTTRSTCSTSAAPS